MSKKTEINWTDIYDRESGKLLSLCRRYVGDIQIAEDLVHDGFMKAIEKIDSYKGEGVFEGWLQRIVVNTVMDYLRSNKRNNLTDVDDLQIAEEETETQETLLVKTEFGSIEFTHQDLLDTIDALPQHHKTVFNLFAIEGYSHKDIAEMLQIEINTSKSHLARARKKIQDLLTEKAENMKKDKENKRRRALAWIPLAGISAKAHPIDSLFHEAFAEHRLEKPSANDKLKAALANAKPVSIKAKKKAFYKKKTTYYWAGGIIGTIILALLFLQDSNNTTSKNEAKPNKNATRDELKNQVSIADSLSHKKNEQEFNLSNKKSNKQNPDLETTPKLANKEHKSLIDKESPTNKNKEKNQNKTTSPELQKNTAVSNKSLELKNAPPAMAMANAKADSSKKPEKVIIHKQVVIKKTLEIEENTLP